MADTYSTGVVTAYGIAKLGGYTGTYEEFCEQQARYAENAQAVADAAAATETAKNAAETAATNASESATTASNKAEEAAQSAATSQTAASTATSKAADALSSANSAESAKTSAQAAQTAAENAKGTAVESATTAVAKATEAAQSATTATNKAVEATEKAEEAKDAADEISATRDVLEDAFPIASASGVIITVTDAVNLPVEKLSVTLAPIQDLHGQDSPYPAGGGKNKFDSSILTEQASLKTVKLSLPPGTYTMSTSKPDNDLVVYFSLSSDSILGSTTVVFDTHPVTRTIPDGDTAEVGFERIDGDDVFSNYWFQIEEGSTATAYAPYENICPITGRDEVTVARTGVNIFDGEVVNGRYNQGEFVESGSYRCSKNPMPCYPGMQVYFRDKSNAALVLYVTLFTAAGDFISTTSVSTGNWTIPVGSGARWFKVHTTASVYTAATPICIALEAPSAYAPYDGTSVTVQFGQTVYGGTVDVVAGKVHVTHELVDMGTFAWSPYADSNPYVGSAYCYFEVTNYALPEVNDTAIMSNVFKNIGRSGARDVLYTFGFVSVHPYIWLRIYDGEYHSRAEWQAKLAEMGAKVVLPLAEPFDIDITPATLSTLKGDNTVWSDGDSVEMDYRSANRILSDADKEDIAELVFDMIPDADTTGY